MTYKLAKGIFKPEKSRGFLNFARLVAIISVMLGTSALLISLSIIQGFQNTILKNAIKSNSHISVRKVKGMDIYNPNSLVTNLRVKFHEITATAEFIQKEAILRSKTAIDGAIIRSIESDKDFYNLKKDIISGNFDFSSHGAAEIILGSGLAKNLSAVTGDRIIIFSFSGFNTGEALSNKITQLTVRGIIQSGLSQADNTMAIVPFGLKGKLFGTASNYVTGIDLMISNVEDSPVLAGKISSYLGYPYICTDVYSENAAVFAWINLQKEPIPLVLGLISIVAVFNIVTILLLGVVEKTRTIGILRALGMKSGKISEIFVLQGLTVGIFGTALGCLLGISFYFLQDTFKLIRLQGEIYYLSFLPVEFSSIHYIIVAGTSLILSLAASLIPSIFAAKISPLQAIRFK